MEKVTESKGYKEKQNKKIALLTLSIKTIVESINLPTDKANAIFDNVKMILDY